MKPTIVFLTVGALAGAFSLSAFAQSRVDNELTAASQVMHDLTGPQSKAGIPDDVLRDAKCVAVIPKMVKAGFVFGGQHGAGVATCRTSGGHWSAPAPFDLTGMTWGAQIGGEVQGYVMMIMNDQGMQALMSGHFKVGAGVDAAAGPVGREGSGSAGNNAAILSYANAKGAYIGATLNGTELNQDHGETQALYGQPTQFQAILNGQVSMPSDSAAHEFVATIHRSVDRAETNTSAQ
jgi:SH3 domain-containing YSC84-like protein 1